ncbi:MAG: hypothetical protein JXA60_09810 [Candidatus Coatesbacteria bacterium]|nr:hypothetical protein [Candidatus Coatesbacteria bacterium]
MQIYYIVTLILLVYSLSEAIPNWLKASGYYETRYRYEFDRSTDDSNIADDQEKEKKSRDGYFLYGGKLGLEAKFKNNFWSAIELGINEPDGLSIAPQSPDLILTQASVNYKNINWEISFGRYSQKENSAISLHYYTSEPVDNAFSKRKGFLTGFKTAFFDEDIFKIGFISDIVSEGFTTEYKSFEDNEYQKTPGENQTTLGFSFDYKPFYDFMEASANLYYTDKGINGNQNADGTYSRLPSKRTGGLEAKLNFNKKTYLNLGFAHYYSFSQADAEGNIKAMNNQEKAFIILGNFFRKLKFGSTDITLQYARNYKLGSIDGYEKWFRKNNYLLNLKYPIELKEFIKKKKIKNKESFSGYLIPMYRIYNYSWNPYNYEESQANPKADRFVRHTFDLILRLNF